MKTSTYWNGVGKYHALYRALLDLTPDFGPCPDADGTNKHLDRFRRAANCYYDLFNNGLCNRGAEFRALFKVGKLPRLHTTTRLRLDLNQIERDGKVEARMDALILAAAEEQAIALAQPDNGPIKDRDLAALLNRAAAVMEDPASETEQERRGLIEDLRAEADKLNT